MDNVVKENEDQLKIKMKKHTQGNEVVEKKLKKLRKAPKKQAKKLEINLSGATDHIYQPVMRQGQRLKYKRQTVICPSHAPMHGGIQRLHTLRGLGQASSSLW